MKVYNKIILTFLILMFILSLKCFAYEGEVVTFDGITTKMPKIVTEITDDDPMQIRELNKNNTELNQGSVMMARVGASTEGINNIISKYANEKTAVGIDVSYYQGSIDWKQVADSGVTFAIIRCGYRGYGSEGTLVEDVRFKEYIQGALDNGIYVGIYFFSAAISEEEAIQEAKMTVDLIKNYNITYPVAYDFEYYGNWTSPSGNPYRTNGLSNEQMNKNAKAFLNYVKSKGYKASLYGSTSYLNDTWDMNSISKDYDTWVAHYGVSKPTYQGSYQMWQCGDNGIVPGISTKVDVDIDYHYYATMKTRISGKGYIKSGPLDWKYDGATIGTVGQGTKLEKLRICLTNKVLSGTIQYRSQIQDIGWENGWRTDNQITGLDGKRLETIQVRLTEEMAVHYDVYYRVHVQDYGWLGWAKNGESAGTEGKSKRVEAIELKLIPKHANPPGSTANRFVRSNAIKYKSYVRGLGWQKTAWEGSSSGTTGLGKKIESLNIELTSKQYDGGIEYRAHVQDLGWTSYVKDGANAGSPDSNKRLEAIEVRLYGDVTNYYDVYYRVHCQNVGWLDWGKNGEAVGTMGQSLRIEAIEIKLVDKGAQAPGKTTRPLVRGSLIKYRSGFSSDGWKPYVWEGNISGALGDGKKMEAIQIELTSNLYDGGIEYRSHIQNKGWESNFVKAGEISGNLGSGLRNEAIQIRLYGDMANYLDVYYRVCVPNFGWLGWAKNGATSGTSGYGYRIEGYEVKLVNKNASAPGNTVNSYVQK